MRFSDRLGGTSSIQSQIYHYGSVENFKQHKRRYTFDQFISYNEFIVSTGDSTMGKYPKRTFSVKLRERFQVLYSVEEKWRKLKSKIKSIIKEKHN